MRTYVTRGTDHTKLADTRYDALRKAQKGTLADLLDFVDAEKAVSHKMGYQAGWKQGSLGKDLPGYHARKAALARAQGR